jgi:hypothetical protein
MTFSAPMGHRWKPIIAVKYRLKKLNGFRSTLANLARVACPYLILYRYLQVFLSNIRKLNGKFSITAGFLSSCTNGWPLAERMILEVLPIIT